METTRNKKKKKKKKKKNDDSNAKLSVFSPIFPLVFFLSVCLSLSLLPGEWVSSSEQTTRGSVLVSIQPGLVSLFVCRLIAPMDHSSVDVFRGLPVCR